MVLVSKRKINDSLNNIASFGADIIYTQNRRFGQTVNLEVVRHSKADVLEHMWHFHSSVISNNSEESLAPQRKHDIVNTASV